MTNSLHPTERRSSRIAAPSLVLLLLAAAASPAAVSAEVSMGRAQLQDEARTWLAALTAQSTQKIALSSPDERIRVSECVQPWEFDLPFGPGQALRARCPSPSQQVFLMTQAVKAPAVRGAIEPLSPNAPRAVAGASAEAQSAKTTAWVLGEPVDAGTPLSPRYLVRAEIAAQAVREDLISDPQALQHLEAIRPLKAGTPLRKGDLRPIKLIKRGELVTVSLEPVSGLSIRARLEATEDGIWGQRIKLKNTQSGRTTTARVMGPGQAQGL